MMREIGAVESDRDERDAALAGDGLRFSFFGCLRRFGKAAERVVIRTDLVMLVRVGPGGDDGDGGRIDAAVISSRRWSAYSRSSA